MADTAVVARRVRAVIDAGPDARGPDGTVRLYLQASTPGAALASAVLAYVRCAVRVASGGQNLPVPPLVLPSGRTRTVLCGWRRRAAAQLFGPRRAAKRYEACP
jgi:hypothetical protein